VELPVDDVGEPSLEAPERFSPGLAFGPFAGEVVGGAGLVAGLGDGDHVEGPVQSAVAAAVEAMPVGSAGGRRDGGGAVACGERSGRSEPADVADFAQDAGGVQMADADDAGQGRAGGGDEDFQLGVHGLESAVQGGDPDVVPM